MEQSLPDKVKKTMESFHMAEGGLLDPGRALCAAPEGTGRKTHRTRILAAVSGGADSVCLLLVLRELGFDVQAVHVEHGIRGAESLEDCAFVRNLCEERGIPLRVVSVDAPSAARQGSMSLEEAARTLRWNALFESAERLGIQVIATAHHQMDQAETVLWNLIRGSSVAGLGGIRPCRRTGDLTVIRPLIWCGRDRIEDYLRQKGVSWRTDSTNSDTSVTRNAIRLKILPLLEELNPGAVRHIAQAASDLAKVDEWLLEQTDEAWKEVILEDFYRGGSDLTADRNALRNCPFVIRMKLLRRMIARCLGGEKDVSRAHAEAVDRLVFGPNGHEACLPDGLRAVSEEGVLRMTRRKIRKPEMTVPLDRDGIYRFPGGRDLPVDLPVSEDGMMTLEVSHILWSGGEAPKKRYTKVLAYDTMAPCPVLRTRREGDYLIVNASNGRRKLKDYLIDEKVPRQFRDTIPLIAQGSHVLWVIGMRISEGAKVTEGVKALRISASGESADDSGSPGPTGGLRR